MRVQRALVYLSLACVATAIGCSRGAAVPGEGDRAERPKTPDVPVEIVLAISEEVIEYREFTGRTIASHSVEIRPRVSGYLDQAPRSANTHSSSAGSPSTGSLENKTFQVLVAEGASVEKGDPLFEIDPRPYNHALMQAKGSRLAMEAQQRRNQSELARLERLKTSNAISDSDLEIARANVSVVEAQLQTLVAAEARAELDLEFTQIEAPISGVIGRSLVMQGNIVAADTTLLTTVVSSDPIHVLFELDEPSYLLYRQLAHDGLLPKSDNAREGVKVSLSLSNDKDFPHQGTIDFANNTTDPNSGNTLLRAEFANEELLTDSSEEPFRALAPGLYCQVRVPFSAKHHAIVVPTKCLAMDQQGKYVMVVGPDNIVRRRTIATGSVQGMYTVIKSGLAADEKVVYEGLQKVRDGSGVAAKESENVPPFQQLDAGA